MVKSFIKVMLSIFFKKYREPEKERFIKLYDHGSGKCIEMFWRKDSFIESELYKYGLYGRWERQSLKIWAALSKRAHLILDVGANTGVFSLISQSNNSSAKIIAVEPIQINYELLELNIKKNNFPVSVERIALSNYDGNASMFMLKDRLNYMTSINDNRYKLHPEVAGDTKIIEVVVDVKPYEYLQNKYSLKNVDLIKIDVEGHEFSVLESMYPELKVSLPSIVVEIISDDSANKINKLLEGLSYRYFSIDEVKNSLTLVSGLWNNDHQNFLICTQGVADYLNSVGLMR
ncbi:FkbM family methyltransferase [Methylomonas sp. LW13]|uniref:FkbM family methyltransferase n=1 Tax=unclassified Methylomonas TaxID=2608980 RepID=UPI00051BDD94|nr:MULTISPECIES: FkbM family methyltransferase [unclassified Methylomonas]PKD39944.1 hypothetical protein CWO84_12710 [Methylomonas sp. Kb3]QBC27280.1 FkbM family methyltransferase [Methylomonas sp. LW13]